MLARLHLFRRYAYYGCINGSTLLTYTTYRYKWVFFRYVCLSTLKFEYLPNIAGRGVLLRDQFRMKQTLNSQHLKESEKIFKKTVHKKMQLLHLTRGTWSWEEQEKWEGFTRKVKQQRDKSRWREFRRTTYLSFLDVHVIKLPLPICTFLLLFGTCVGLDNPSQLILAALGLGLISILLNFETGHYICTFNNFENLLKGSVAASEFFHESTPQESLVHGPNFFIQFHFRGDICIPSCSLVFGVWFFHESSPHEPLTYTQNFFFFVFISAELFVFESCPPGSNTPLNQQQS
jgi:hypothetical protein